MPLHTLLLVEDNPDDAFLMARALKKSGLVLTMHLVENGVAAIDYLRGSGDFADRSKFPLPNVTFLDLKLPYLGGFEVLEWIRGHPELSELTVVILTSSGEDRDYRRAHELKVAAYLVKPPKPEILIRTIEPLLAQIPIGVI